MALVLRARWFTRLVGVAVCCAAAPTHAQNGDYLLTNQGWNGLSQFVDAARAAGIEVRAPDRLDLSLLKPQDGMLVVYPDGGLPRADLAAFMSDGGRLAIADDFGAGDTLLAGFGIGRHDPNGVARERRLRGNVNVLIAKPEVRHPLSAGVAALVTNHPQVLHHESLEAIFSLDAQHSAIVLSGGVGKGRLVALGDPSTLINNMLEFRGNRTFARNLADYLTQHAPGERGRLWLLTRATQVVEHYGHAAGADPLGLLRSGLQRIAQVHLSPAALRLTTIALVLMLLFGAATALPRRSSYARAVALPVLETSGGFAGRVRFFERTPHDLSAPSLVYKAEFERRLLQALMLTGEATLSGLEQALRDAGIPREQVSETRALLVELERISLTRDRPDARTPVPARKFHAMVAAGDRILAALEGRGARKSR
jgi:hypothetical protein